MKENSDAFIPLTNDGERMTCAMPTDETIVEVHLSDGSTRRALYACNIMDAGDWDFMAVDADDEPTDDTLIDVVVAWRPVSESPS